MRLFHSLLLLATWLTLPQSLPAQLINYPEPSLYSIFPSGAQRGQTVAVELRSQGGLAGATQVVVEGPPGITVSEVKLVHGGMVTANFTIAADAAPGRRRVRVLGGESGLTSFRWFFVGSLPETLEQEKNNSPAEAQQVTLPVIVNGRVNPILDQDYFRFTAKQGQQLVAAVLGHGLDAHTAYRAGFLDARLELFDSGGSVIASAEDSLGLDPLIHTEIPRDGEYTLRLTTLEYKGSDYATYRLTLGEVPYPTAVFPAGGRQGETAEVELSGPNVPAGTRQQVTFATEGNSPVMYLADPLTGYDLPLAVGELPEVVEAEPNNDSATATRLMPGSTVNGRFLEAEDEDWYQLSLKQGEGVLLRIVAQRELRSPVDSLLEIYNAAKQKLTENDDGDTFRGQIHGDYGSLDSQVIWTAPADGEYFVRVTDQNSQSGPGTVYRLTAEPLQPDFWLFQWPDAVPVWGPGSTATFIVEAQHWGGFQTDMQIRIEGLPPGWTGSVADVPWERFRYYGTSSNCDKFLLSITAPPDAKPGDVAPFRIFGRAEQNGRVIEHEARYLTLYGNSHNDRMHLRSSPGAVAVVAPRQSARIEAETYEFTGKPGETIQIPVRLVRTTPEGKPPEEIGLVVNGPTVAAGCGWGAPMTVPGNVDQFQMPLKIPAETFPGVYSIVVARAWISDIRGGRPGSCTRLIQLRVLPATP